MPAMDLLTPMLRDAGLRRRLLGARALQPDEALRFPCDRSIGFHVVLRGPVWLQTRSALLRLEAGDIAFMARGETHGLLPREQLQGLALRTLGMDDEAGPGAPLPEQGPLVISGAYQLWHAPLHPALNECPPWQLMRAGERTSSHPVEAALGLLRAELQAPQAGGGLAGHALLDLLFTYLLRELLAARPQQAGFAAATQDPALRRALQLLQQDCARAWTLQQLAQAAGLSRSVLAARFRRSLGDTPQAYLRTLRIQRAMRLLSETEHKLEAVAQAVGYADAFALSKAFKRVAGCSPLAFRRADRAQAGSAWRFGPADALGEVPSGLTPQAAER